MSEYQQLTFMDLGEEAMARDLEKEAKIKRRIAVGHYRKKFGVAFADVAGIGQPASESKSFTIDDVLARLDGEKPPKGYSASALLTQLCKQHGCFRAGAVKSKNDARGVKTVTLWRRGER